MHPGERCGARQEGTRREACSRAGPPAHLAGASLGGQAPLLRVQPGLLCGALLLCPLLGVVCNLLLKRLDVGLRSKGRGTTYSSVASPTWAPLHEQIVAPRDQLAALRMQPHSLPCVLACMLRPP